MKKLLKTVNKRGKAVAKKKSPKNANSLRVLPGLGERIVSARKDAGLSQVTLAAAAGHNQAWLQKIENDERALLTIDFVAIAQAIGVAMESLIPEQYLKKRK